MRTLRSSFLLGLFLVCFFGSLCLAPLVASQTYPVRLERIENYVVVLNDGRLDIRYSLTFTELEAQGRNEIRELGPFPQPHVILSSEGEGPDGTFSVDLKGGPSTYRV